MKHKLALILLIGIFLIDSTSAVTTICNSCEDCNAKLNGDYSVVKLTGDIVNHSGTCIELNANNTEFDCQGHVIDGNGSSYDDGIYMYEKSGNRVKNCVVTGFGNGISLLSSNYNTLTDNTASNNNYGIHLGGSYNNTITGNTASNNIGGILLGDSSNNTFTNNTVSNNYHGIWLMYSSNNILINNTINSNTWYGVLLDGSSNNTLIENTASSNNWDGIYLHYSSTNTITTNIINSNNHRGIRLYSSSNNTLTDNTVNSNNYSGIYLDESNYNTLIENTASNNYRGIVIAESNYNTLNSNHVCSNTGLDFYLSGSSGTSGDENTCDNPDGWDDTGTTGCTYPCSEITTTSTTSTTTTSSTTTSIIVVTYNETKNFTAGNVSTVDASTINVTLDIVTNSNVSNANITVASYSGNPTNKTFSVSGLGKYLEINISSALENVLNWSLLRTFFTEQEINDSNLNKSTLGIYYYNTTESDWQRLNESVPWMGNWVFETGVNETSNYVWANLSHFSTYTVGGTSLTSSIEIALVLGWNLISIPLVI